MKPALLTFPHISSYPLMLLLGVFAGWLLSRKLARRWGIEPRHVDNITLMMPVLGLAGARFFARLFYAKVGFWEAAQIWKGDGLVFYGGFIFCIAGIILYALAQKLPVARLLDLLAPATAAGLAFGRVGCFLAGCCWGDFCVEQQKLALLTPERIEQVHTVPALSKPDFQFGVRFPARSDVYKTQMKWGLLTPTDERSLPVHPVQLYEAAAAAILALLLWKAGMRNIPPGRLSLALLACYATIRFVTEFFRGDNRIGETGFTVSQGISVYLALGTLAVLLIQKITQERRRRAGEVKGVELASAATS